MQIYFDALRRLDCLFLLLIALVLLAATHPHAALAAAAGGGSLPWDTPLTTLKNDITGPVAFTISLLAMVACGAALVFGGEIHEFVRRIIMLVLVASFIVGVTNLASALKNRGWTMRLCSNRAASVGRRLALAATVLAVLAAAPHSAQSQLAVTCVNCSTIWNQLLEYGKQVQQLATQLQSYQTQLQQYANMVTNTLALPQQLWGQVQSDIMQVKNLSNAASLLSGNAGSIVTRLQSASAYANQAASLGNIAGQFTTWQQTIGNSVSTLGKTLGMQQNQQASDAALLASLEQHSQSAQGQMQAIQAGNELAHATAVQLQQIQATLAVTAQMRATEMAVDADRRASQDAAMLHFSTPTPVPTSGYTRY